MASASQCILCPSGYYCGSYNLKAPTGLCPSGLYCGNGSFEGVSCPTGSFCVSGAIAPTACPPGTFQNLPGQSSCSECPAGFFCPQGVISYGGGAYDCPRGYYCLNGTQYSNQYPCPAGTFNNQSNGRSLADCSASPGGYYVNGTGNAIISGPCSGGYYCPERAVTATPVCDSTYCSTGGRCVPGQYCPVASIMYSPCPGGYYCGDYSGSITGQCAAGYYCTQGSYTSTPVALFDAYNISIGGLCPTGFFCPQGSSVPLVCPLGSFSAAQSTSAADCHACPLGYYCTSPSVQVCLQHFFSCFKAFLLKFKFRFLVPLATFAPHLLRIITPPASQEPTAPRTLRTPLIALVDTSRTRPATIPAKSVLRHIIAG
jgi:hypothetical protein